MLPIGADISLSCAAAPELRQDLLRPARGNRPVHPTMLAQRERQGSCGDGRDARRRRSKSAHPEARGRCRRLPLRLGRDDDRRIVRDLRRLAFTTSACRARAASAAGSSQSLPARADWAVSLRRSIAPVTASRGNSLPNSCRKGWEWIFSSPSLHTEKSRPLDQPFMESAASRRLHACTTCCRSKRSERRT
jgi:hypothetical protein